MNPEGNGLVYADQQAAEHAASEYRGNIIDIADVLADTAIAIDSLKLARIAQQLSERIKDVNF
jgi:hypothetical protein